MSILCDTSSIRDVIAFPKGLNYTDPLSKAPVAISRAELDLYHINVSKESTEETNDAESVSEATSTKV